MNFEKVMKKLWVDKDVCHAKVINETSKTLN